jgi:gas vesicle protein
MGAAKNLDIALKVAEEGAKVARKAKVKPTVKEAERVAFPGIYDDPRIIAEKASGRVASESPAMKQLFGVTRDDLYEMSKGRKGNIEGKLPGAAENPKGSKAAEKVMTKKNEQRLLDALYESEKYPELVKGMDPWYTMDPLFKQMVQLMGEEKAVKEYKKFNTLLGMASPGSEVTTEIPRGTAAYFLQKEGRFPEFEEFAGMPAAKRREIDFPQDILNVPGHMYHKTAHSTPMAKFLETGELGMDSPKVPMYIEASGVPETGFQTDIPVGDAHWSRAVGLGDTRTSKNFGASVSTPEMSMLAPWWRKKIAGEVGIESVPAQARTWGLFSPQTGVTTPIGKPKLEMISDKIMETARRLNISPEEARDLVLMGKTYAGKAGGGSIKALDKALKVGEKAAKETLKKAKDYKPTKGMISELKDYVRDAKGEYGAQRVERAADLVPNLEKQYDLKALQSAFDGDNAKSLMVIHPGDFEKYAKPLPDYYGKPVEAIKFENGKQVPTIIQPEHQYSIKTGLDESGMPKWDSKKMHPEEYLDLLGGIARDKGFDWLPYLMLGKESGGTFRIAGHEGRHRNRALNKLGDEATLINLLPQNIREGLPRRLQEEYQQGLIELLGPKPKVRPEDTYEKETRRMIELPEFFAEGGSSKKPSFFPKDSKPHKQGFPIEYEEYYPRSTRPESELLEEFNKDELTAKDYLKAAPTIAKTVGKMLKEQAVEELPTYTEPRAIPDIALNALATGVGSVSDLAFLGSGVDRPPLGSERLMDMLADLGVTTGTKRPLAENLLAVASPKVLRTAEKGINKLAPIVERSFTPITTTVEAVAPDLAKFKPIDFQEYVTNRLISNQYGGVPTKIMGDRITSKLPAQGVYFNEAGQLETNPMMAIDIPNVKDISKATELRSDIASAGKALNQESMAGIRFLPLATNKVDDATAILVRPKDGKITNEDVIKLGNEFGNSMVVSHNPRLGGVVLAPFGEPSGELQIAKSKIKDLFGSDMDIRAGHSSLQKDRFYMPRSDYSKEGARKVSKATKELRQELKKFETLRYPRPSSPSRTNPLTGDISD